MIRRQFRPILLALLLLPLLPLPVGGMGDALPWESLLRPPAAEIAAAEEAVASAAGSEEEIAALLRTLGNKGTHEREATKLLAVHALLEEATGASRLLLEDLSREDPELTLLVPGCREPIEIPRYPYPALASEALRQLDRRTERAARLVALREGDIIAFLPPPGAAIRSPATEAAAELVRELGPEEAARLAVELMARPPGWSAWDTLLTEAWLASAAVPDPYRLAAFSPAAALEALRRSVALPEEERRPWLVGLARNGGTRSAAALELARLEPEDASPAGLLRAHGAEGAVRLARGGAPGWQARLVAELALTSIRPAETARHGALALMLDGSEEARAALEALLAADILAPAAEEEVRRWLASRPSSS